MKNLTEYSRFFSFGCSFTQYSWPTWADILGREATVFENWAHRGGGNKFILNSLAECHRRNTIDKNDLVIVMWSTIAREDRFIKGKWILNGNVYRSHDHFGKDFLAHCVDIDGYLLETCNYISAAQQMLENIGCEYYFLSMIDIRSDPQRETHKISGNLMEQQIFSLYESVLDRILPSVHKVIFDYDWLKFPANIKYRMDFLSQGSKAKVECDMHPTPLQHYHYLQKIFPDFKASVKTLDFVNEWEQIVQSQTPDVIGKLEKHNLYHTQKPKYRFGLG